MLFSIPNLLIPYGRYINRFRAVIDEIDGLLMVERRVLLIASKEPKNKMVKSAKIVGNTIAEIHPHGDQSTYKVLVKLALNGFFRFKGGKGSVGLFKAEPSAMRYTESSLENWVRNLAFQYNSKKYNTWEVIENIEEPISLPCPIPIGLIGSGMKQSISFFRSYIPLYTADDLLTRLIWLLTNDGEEPIIKPNIPDCHVESDEFKNILIHGSGKLTFIPKGEIIKCNKKISPTGEYIAVKGLSPTASFNALKEQEGEHYNLKEGKKLDLGELVRIIPKKDVETKSLFEYCWKKFLVKKDRANVLACDKNNNVKQLGIDQIILNSYNHWINCCRNKRICDFYESVKKYFDMNVILLVREIFLNNKCKTVNEVVTIYESTDPKILQIQRYNIDKKEYYFQDIIITPDHIKDVCSKKTINKIIETKINLDKILEIIENEKNEISKVELDCLKEVKDMKKNGISEK